jgi:hypothetical protein
LIIVSRAVADSVYALIHPLSSSPVHRDGAFSFAIE